jgi:hypothetical protein
VTTNAGIPGTGLSYRSKTGGHGGKLGILAIIAGLGFWAVQHWSKIEKTIAPQAASRTHSQMVVANVPALPAAGSTIRYVHRDGSVLRETESTSGKSLKKEVKGAEVTLLASDGEWTQVQDGTLAGWMRTSVLGTEPPN